jgi:hypothetical protein
VPKLG